MSQLVVDYRNCCLLHLYTLSHSQILPSSPMATPLLSKHNLTQWTLLNQHPIQVLLLHLILLLLLQLVPKYCFLIFLHNLNIIILDNLLSNRIVLHNSELKDELLTLIPFSPYITLIILFLLPVSMVLSINQ